MDARPTRAGRQARPAPGGRELLAEARRLEALAVERILDSRHGTVRHDNWLDGDILASAASICA